jgi:hypothetical protein
MPEVLVQHLRLEALGMVDLDPSVAPLDDLGVVIRQHFRQLVQELGDGVVLAVPIRHLAGKLVNPASAATAAGRPAIVIVGAIQSPTKPRFKESVA